VSRFSSIPNDSNSAKKLSPADINLPKSEISSPSVVKVDSPTVPPSEVKKPIDSPKPKESISKKSEISPPKVSQKVESKSSIEVEKTAVPEVHMNSTDFMAKIIKLGEIAKECEEMVETEDELSQKEKTKLYLKRDEFKKLLLSIKGTSRTVF